MRHTVITRFIIFASAGIFLPAAFCEEPPADDYKGKVEIGYIQTSGNTETQTINAKTRVEATYNKWRQILKLEALGSSDGERTIAERYLASLKTDYRFSKRNYAFGLLGYENDRFSGYNYRTSITLGYGRRLIDHPSVWLDVEGGPGGRFSELDDGESQDEITGRLAANLGWKISDASQFDEDLSTEIGEDVTITRSIASLSTEIIGRLSMKIAYAIKYVSDVPPGIEKRDTETSVTLAYQF